MNEEEILSGAPSPVSLAFRGVSYSVPVDRGRARKDKLERQRKETERYGSAGRTNKTYLNQLRGWLKRTSRKEETLKVLHSVDGLFPPGRLSAIMGPSGGGKSSLLDVLAGRNKLGTVEGDVLIAGNHLKELKEGTLQSLAGYVMQDDAFLSNLTVKETLEFALRFRVASSLLTDKLVDSTVDSLLALLNLTSVANSHVGSPLKRGISGGERRRLSIGCELTVRPPLLFLDEPTSGLDASNALRIMRLLRTLANSGHTIIASIHQPRSSIFKMFDRVLVLDHGKEAYFGPGGDECVENLQTFSGKECGRWENPADWLIDLLEEDGFDDLDEKVDSEEARAGLTGFGNATAHESEGSNGTANGTSHIVELQRKSLTETYSNSTLHASLLSSLSDLERTPLPSPIPPPTFSTLLKLCTKRQFLQTLRDPGIVYIRTGAALAIGILVGLIFFRQDQSVPAGRVNALLFLMCVFGLFCLPAISQLIAERLLFQRERASGLVTTSAFYLAGMAIEVPVLIAVALLYGIVSYWLVGFYPSAAHFFTYCLIITLTILVGFSATQIGSAASSSIPVAVAFYMIFLVASLLLGGFMIGKEQLPSGAQWLFYLSYFFWGYSGLMINEFTDRPYGAALLERDGMGGMSKWTCVGVLVAFFVVFRTIAFLMLHFLYKEKR